MTINSASILATAWILPGVEVTDWRYAIVVALVLAVLNAIVKPLLIIFTLPATVLTLGLFLVVINAFIIWLADYILASFNTDSFWWAMLFAIVMAIINSILEKVLLPDERKQKYQQHHEE